MKTIGGRCFNEQVLCLATNIKKTWIPTPIWTVLLLTVWLVAAARAKTVPGVTVGLGWSVTRPLAIAMVGADVSPWRNPPDVATTSWNVPGGTN